MADIVACMLFIYIFISIHGLVDLGVCPMRKDYGSAVLCGYDYDFDYGCEFSSASSYTLLFHH